MVVVSLLFLLIAVEPAQAVEPPSELNVATLNWPPYVDSSAENGGILVQHLQEILTASGMTSQIDYLPWARALTASGQGEYDILFPAYDSTERRQDFLYVYRLPSGPVGFYVRKEDGLSGATLDDLRALRLGVVSGYINVPQIDDDPTWNIDEARNDRLNLIKLGNGRVDLVFMDKQVGEQIVSAQEPWLSELVEFIDVGFKTPDLYVCVPKRLPYAKALSAAILKTMERSENVGTD